MPSDGRDRRIATERRVMLLILIPIAWLTVAVVVVAVCQASARGESERRTSAPEQRYVIQERLVVWDHASTLAPRSPSAAPARATRRMRTDAPGRQAARRRR